MAQRDYRSDAYRQALLNELDPATGLPGRTTQASYSMPAPDWSGGGDYSAGGGVEDLMAGYERRNEGAGGFLSGAGKGAATGATIGSVVPGLGTIAGGAIGGIVGGIGGLFTKNAKTAATDFAVEDARDMLNRGYQQYLGRPASADEINSQLAGQGWNAGRGDRWVGEAGMRSMLDILQNSEEARRYAGTQSQPAGGRAYSQGSYGPAGSITGPGGAGVTAGFSSPATGTATPAGSGQFTGGSGALVDPYQLPAETDLESLLTSGQRYTNYDANTGRIGVAGGGTGGYASAGFDFGQDAANRDIGKSAKYAFSYLADRASSAGAPMPRTKQEAEQWFTQHIAPGLQQLGYAVEWVQGDKAQVRTREGVDIIDFVIGADGDNPTLGWQSELLAPGGGMSAGAMSGGGGGGLPTSGNDLTSSALFDQLLRQARDIAAGKSTGAMVTDTDALLSLLNG